MNRPYLLEKCRFGINFSAKSITILLLYMYHFFIFLQDHLHLFSCIFPSALRKTFLWMTHISRSNTQKNITVTIWPIFYDLILKKKYYCYYNWWRSWWEKKIEKKNNALSLFGLRPQRRTKSRITQGESVHPYIRTSVHPYIHLSVRMSARPPLPRPLYRFPCVLQDSIHPWQTTKY